MQRISMGRSVLYLGLVPVLALLLSACTDLTVDPNPQQDADDLYMLTVSLVGTGEGKVQSSPEGIDCGGQCEMAAERNSGIVLTAIPGMDSDFEGWSGGCTGTSTTCALTLSSNVQVTATFGESSADGGNDEESREGPSEPEPDPDDTQDPEPDPEDDRSGPEPGTDQGDTEADVGPSEPSASDLYSRLLGNVSSRSTGRYDFFGSHVSVSGDQAIVSAPHGESETSEKGAYFFERRDDSWVEVGYVEPEDMYGWATPVDIGGSVAVMANADGGEASNGTNLVIFERNGDTWELGAQLFGGPIYEQWSTNYDDVAVSGRSVLTLVERNDQYSVHVYEEINGVWQIAQDQDLSLAGADSPHEVHASGDHLFVVAADSVHTWLKDDDGIWRPNGELSDVGSGALSVDTYAEFRNGSMNIYRYDGNWELEETLAISDAGTPISSSRIEYDLDGDDLVVATWDDELHLSPSELSVSVFRRNDGSWVRVNEFPFEDPEGDARRGAVTVALDDGNLAIGLERDTDARGDVYFFTHGP